MFPVIVVHGPEPLTGILGPKVMIVNEMAGSGGDMLPYMFREMKDRSLVGSRTWGGPCRYLGRTRVDGWWWHPPHHVVVSLTSMENGM
jgi:hypothetical protein